MGGSWAASGTCSSVAAGLDPFHSQLYEKRDFNLYADLGL